MTITLIRTVSESTMSSCVPLWNYGLKLEPLKQQLVIPSDSPAFQKHVTTNFSQLSTLLYLLRNEIPLSTLTFMGPCIVIYFYRKAN
jgi:hypothetical protein